MGINLFFSNDLATLAEKLHEALDLEYRDTQHVFSAPLIIVPNANLKKWTHLHHAKKTGIVFNVDFQYMESGLWYLLKLLTHNDKGHDPLSLNLRQLVLLHVLKNIEPDQPDFAPVINYLKGSENPESPYDVKRLWQLSEKLAFLFQEYEFHRTEMIRKWLKNDLSNDAMEVCQQGIYLKTKMILDKYLKTKGNDYLSLMEFSREVFSQISIPHIEKSEKNYVHFFGFSNISTFHIDLIKKLGHFFTIFIYSINPCREFWEDIKTPWENRWIKQHSPRDLSAIQNDAAQKTTFFQSSSPLLSLWGKPGRESIRMLCHLVDYDFTTSHVLRKNNGTVLEKIQNRILTLQNNEEPGPGIFQDTSLQIVACPSRFREVETVYNSILYNLNHDSSLKLTDIAVQVPDISDYKPWIDAVFDRDPKVLTYNLADAHAHMESLYGKAILGLLELAFGKFSRQKVFELLLNPCLMEKWRLSIEDIQIFAGWCRELNIFHTFDQNTKSRMGYIPSDMYTWKQGLIRLKLSRILSEPWDILSDQNPALSPTERHFHGKVPYSDTTTGDLELVEKFCMIIETLHLVSLEFSQGPLTGKVWKRNFIAACHNLFEVPYEVDAENTVRKALFTAIDELCILDRITEHEKSSGIDPYIFNEFIKSRMTGIRGGYGDYLTSGITISALLPMRPIPFRIVYILGMEEGAFPGRAETSSLDLRLKSPMPGDISLPERNCYLFLELLLSVREKLYISYVSKDLQKDRNLQPCSVVNQLRSYIETEILLENGSFKLAEIPLKGSSVKYAMENAIGEHSDILVNYSSADRIMYYREKGLWPTVAKNLSKRENETTASFFPDFSLRPTMKQEQEFLPEEITTRQLGRFLKNPVKESMQKHLRLYEQEETVEDVIIFENEPFYSEYPISFVLKIEPLRMWIDHLIAGNIQVPEKNHPKIFFQQTYDKYRIENHTPEGIYGILDKEILFAQFHNWVETLTPLLSTMMGAKKNPYHALFVGEIKDNPFMQLKNVHTLKLNSLQMLISTFDAHNSPIDCHVKIHGRLPWLWQSDTGTWHSMILTGSEKKPSDKPEHFIIEPVLTYLSSRCLPSEKDPFGEMPLIFHVAYQNEIRSWNCYVAPEEALEYLKELVSQYLNPNIRRWLPFDKVITAMGDSDKLCSSTDMERDNDKFIMKLTAALAESDDPLVHLSAPEIDQHCWQTACLRFGIFLKHLSMIDT